MSLITFVQNAGTRTLGVSDAQAAAAAGAANADELAQKAADAIKSSVTANGLTADGLEVAFDAASSTVIVQGEAPDQATMEKIILVCGNIGGVAAVNDEMSVTEPSDPSQFYTVVAGDNPAKVAARYYGNANDYPKIVEANQPMIVNADKIYPGQLLRIPPQTW